MKRDPHNAALDAEVLVIILAKCADEQAAHALAWMVVQRAQGVTFELTGPLRCVAKGPE